MSWKKTLETILKPTEECKPHITIDSNGNGLNDFYNPRDRNNDGDTDDPGDIHGAVDVNCEGGQNNPVNQSHPTLHSPIDGKVVFVGGNYGTVIIEDANGNLHKLLHLDETAEGLKVDDEIKTGEPIGKMGGTGPSGSDENASDPNAFDQHLDYSIIDKDGNKVDPVEFHDSADTPPPTQDPVQGSEAPIGDEDPSDDYRDPEKPVGAEDPYDLDYGDEENPDSYEGSGETNPTETTDDDKSPPADPGETPPGDEAAPGTENTGGSNVDASAPVSGSGGSAMNPVSEDSAGHGSQGSGVVDDQSPPEDSGETPGSGDSDEGEGNADASAGGAEEANGEDIPEIDEDDFTGEEEPFFAEDFSGESYLNMDYHFMNKHV